MIKPFLLPILLLPNSKKNFNILIIPIIIILNWRFQDLYYLRCFRWG